MQSHRGRRYPIMTPSPIPPHGLLWHGVPQRRKRPGRRYWLLARRSWFWVSCSGFHWRPTPNASCIARQNCHRVSEIRGLLSSSFALRRPVLGRRGQELGQAGRPPGSARRTTWPAVTGRFPAGALSSAFVLASDHLRISRTIPHQYPSALKYSRLPCPSLHPISGVAQITTRSSQPFM
jgi:hypothetical protein